MEYLILAETGSDWAAAFALVGAVWAMAWALK
jgi:hypothetical protein